MNKIDLEDYTCNYEFDNNDKEITIVFSNSLGTNYSMWDDNVPYLSAQFNILRHDTRGHGKSTINQDEISVKTLAEDIVHLIDTLKLEHVVFCGLSIGGLIGQYLAIHHSNRFKKFIICNTAAKIGTEEGWNNRIAQVKEHGLVSVLDGTAERWFSEKYRQNNPAEVKLILKNFAAIPLKGYMACCAAVRDADFRTTLKDIKKPLLIVSGSNDPVTTVEDGNWMQAQIPNAEHETFESAHLSNIEFSQAFAETITQFILK